MLGDAAPAGCGLDCVARPKGLLPGSPRGDTGGDETSALCRRDGRRGGRAVPMPLRAHTSNSLRVYIYGQSALFTASQPCSRGLPAPCLPKPRLARRTHLEWVLMLGSQWQSSVHVSMLQGLPVRQAAQGSKVGPPAGGRRTGHRPSQQRGGLRSMGRRHRTHQPQDACKGEKYDEPIPINFEIGELCRDWCLADDLVHYLNNRMSVRPLSGSVDTCHRNSASSNAS